MGGRLWVLLWVLLSGVALVAEARLPNQAAYDTLAAHILADPALADEVAASDDAIIATAMNVVATPDFWAWRTSVPRSEYLFGTSVDGTTFTFNGNGFVGRTPGELSAWEAVFTTTSDVTNPSLTKVRDAFADIFSGTGNAAANRTHLTTVSRRLVTRAERLFVTGTGSTASPGLLVFEGAVTYLDVAYALRGGEMP